MSNAVAPVSSSTTKYVDEISVSISGRFLFMFIRRDIGLYVLYKIDAVGLYRSLQPEDNLQPLIVFEPDLLPDCDCAFAYIEPYFYIVGQNKRDVFTLNKNRLLKLVPTNNHRGRKFVTRIQPMNLDKQTPLAFAYESKLYVLSKTCANAPYRFTTHYDFELYSPDDASWIGLGNRPPKICEIKSHVIIGTMVYFTTSIQTVLSFNLKAVHWSTVYDPYGHDYFDQNLSNNVTVPTFDTQIQVIGDRVFGGIYQPGEKKVYFYPSHSVPFSDLFLRPSSDQDKGVLEAFSSRFCDIGEVEPLSSSYIVTMDISEEIVCVVCYGSDHSSDGVSCDARLSFFKVAKGFQPSCSTPVEGQTCASLFSSLLEEEGKCANSFKLDYIHHTLLRIPTKKKFTRGIISSCSVV